MNEKIFDTLKYKKELENVGIPSKHAEKQVEIMGKIINLHLATKDEIALEMLAVRKDMATEFAVVRSEMATEFAAVRSEMAAEFKAVRSEMAAEFAAVRSEIATEFKAVRSEMATEFRAVRKEMHEMGQNLENKMLKYLSISIAVNGLFMAILGSILSVMIYLK